MYRVAHCTFKCLLQRIRLQFGLLKAEEKYASREIRNIVAQRQVRLWPRVCLFYIKKVLIKNHRTKEIDEQKYALLNLHIIIENSQIRLIIFTIVG